ncbi:hypothetical protein [Microbacterium sp. B19(2022)]|uniref:hypothetical protein n=1 Tax=Microbacterium sp. B19(2022) TaxID=2914045 RepID=UPI00197BE447|nr:hypothetical protein [Microbacterium sp. B19(2022)]
MGDVTDPQLPPPSGAEPFAPPAPPVAPPAPPVAPPAPPVAPPYATTPNAPVAAYPAAPPGAYQVPVGGYASPAGTYTAPDTTVRPSGLFGTIALVLSLLAAVVAPIIAGIAAFEIGRVLPQGVTTSTAEDLSVLSPARDQVLWAELSFWIGTILGITAIVLGIIAIAKRRGRGTGIAAIVVAVLGAVIFFIVLVGALAAGSATGFATYTS